MARPATSPSARIKALSAAATKAAKLKRGETLTAVPMAKLLGVGWVILKGWCETVPRFAASGAFETGGNGIEWTFRPARTITFLRRHFQSELRRSQAKAKRIRTIVGAEALAGDGDHTLDEMRKMLQLETLLQERKVAAGELVKRADVAARDARVFSAMLRAGYQATQDYDPNGRLSPAERKVGDDVARSILAAQRQVLMREIDGFDGGTA